MSTVFYRVEIGLKSITIPQAKSMTEAINTALEIEGLQYAEFLEIRARRYVVDTPDKESKQLTYLEE